MSEERTNLIKIPGISARVVVDADYDWWGLGELLAGEGDREQGRFLLALSENLQALPGADGLMQLQYLAGLLKRTGNGETVMWLLRELLIRLEEDE